MLIFESRREARQRTRQLLWLFALTVVLLVLAVNIAMILAWGLSWGFWRKGGFSLPDYFIHVNTGITLTYVFGGWWVETTRLAHNGGVSLAKSIGAREPQPRVNFDEQRFCNIVQEMALASRMRPPTPMVLARDYSINAFAAGWDVRDSVVTVTVGALESLTREELQGLVAHEFSHIREGDTRLNMRLAGMVFGLETLFRLGQELSHFRFRIARFLGWALMGAGWLGWIAGHALQAAVSRQREFLADAHAVKWTRSQEALGGVLRKILGQQYEGMQARDFGAFVQHMLLNGNERSSAAGWFDSHPPLEERIRRIYGVEMPHLKPRREQEDRVNPFTSHVPTVSDMAAATPTVGTPNRAAPA